MSEAKLDLVVLGLTITSSWGNGHATTYRGLIRELARAGHRVRFLERDMPWYAQNRDLPQPPYGETYLYRDLEQLREEHGDAVRDADAVVVGSYVPDGIALGQWVVGTARGVTAFYDLDTPVTLACLEQGRCEYISPALVGRYAMYLSFTGGPILERLAREYHARRARPLYCSFDPELYYPEPAVRRWDLGYLGTYGEDRQPALQRLLIEPAKSWPAGRFVVAGPQYPPHIDWPPNVERLQHVSPPEHRAFYNAQRLTLNVTRADMVCAGYAPSVRLFEAAACGVAIISDVWPGLDQFFVPGREIILARDARDVLRALQRPDEQRWQRMGERARRRVLASHTAGHRAMQLVDYVRLVQEQQGAPHGR